MYVNQVITQTGRIKVRSKGLVRTQSSINMLKQKGILTIEVDFSKSQLPDTAVTPAQPTPVATKQVSEKERFDAAIKLYGTALQKQSAFVSALKMGSGLDFAAASRLSQDVIEGVFDNADALSCLTMIKNADEYLLEHSLNCSVLMGLFAKSKGFDEDTTADACLGALLMDIGITLLPEDAQHSFMQPNAIHDALARTHIDLGMEVVEQYHAISDLSLDIIQCHQERVDGSGYPKGLSHDQIPLFARMAAIVDTYDALISPKPNYKHVTPTVALKRLTQHQGLDQSLVSDFIRCIGIHPVGSLVRLASGRLAIVSQHRPRTPLQPLLMSFYSINSGTFSDVKRIDLQQVEDEIVSGVRPEDFSINLPKFFREVFVHQLPDR